jgi:hypothetical protein
MIRLNLINFGANLIMNDRMNKRLGFLALLGPILTAGFMYSLGTADEPEKDDSSSLVYELRTYTTAEGRLPALHARFRDHTMRLFEKHGIKNVMYWTPTDKKNTLVYVIAHKSRAAADKSWKAFVSDADWKKVYKESLESGPIVTDIKREYLKKTEYSPR